MGLLDDLRKKAAAAKDAQDEPAHAEELRVNEIRAVALPAMFRIHRSLSELTAQLNVLQEEASATLQIPGVGDVTGFVQGGYSVSSEGTPPELVTLRCALRLQKPRPLELKTVGSSISAWIDGMRRQGLQAKVLRMLNGIGANQRAYIGIEGSIPVTLQFKIDLEAGALQLFARNFDELAERRQFFNPTSVTEHWCEELLKFVLREENRFMKEELPPDVREQLRRRIEWEKLKDKGVEEAVDSRLASTNRLKSLFKRAPQLKLRYRDRAWDLTTHSGPFTLGRVADCDLQIREQRVSRFHARVELKDDQFYLTDDSTNGTYVRFQDGHAEVLSKSSLVLRGSGLIALGTEATESNPHVVYFSM
jgi:hypothetical protein